MTKASLRHAMTGLLFGTAILHLVVAFFGSAAPELKGPLALFGVIYGAAGLYLRMISGALPVILAMAACATGLALGGANYLQNGGPLSLPLMLAIDVAVIAAGVLWLTRKAQT